MGYEGRVHALTRPCSDGRHYRRTPRAARADLCPGSRATALDGEAGGEDHGLAGGAGEVWCLVVGVVRGWSRGVGDAAAVAVARVVRLWAAEQAARLR